jgi:hypothetical protein
VNQAFISPAFYTALDFPVRISELQGVRGRLGPLVDRDLHFAADRTLNEYAAAARSVGGINA